MNLLYKKNRYINQNRTNHKPFSALPFSAIQDQIDRKGFHLYGCIILTISRGLKYKYLPQYQLFTCFYRLCSPRQKILTWVILILLRSEHIPAHCFTLFLYYLDLKYPLVVCVEHNVLPSEQRKTFLEWPAREPGQRQDWASGQAAKTEPLSPFFFPIFLEKAAELKLRLAPCQEMLFHWSNHQPLRTVQKPSRHSAYRDLVKTLMGWKRYWGDLKDLSALHILEAIPARTRTNSTILETLYLS